MTPSLILFENKSKTVVVLDLVRSIEEAQVLGRDLAADAPQPPLKRLISAPPPATPFLTPEPKNPPAPSTSFSAQLAELMTLAAVEAALAETRTVYTGPWHLPRICQPIPPPPPADDQDPSQHIIIPEGCHYLNGTIDSQRDPFLAQAPSQFDLVVLDPPWPNRSAKRKRGNYHPVRDFDTIRDLLSQIPIASRLSPDGLVAVWITNSSHPADLLTSPNGGIFSQWDVELVGEWTWLKVTAHGEPIVSLGATYRRPWERLLIARKRGGLATGALEPKVIIAVPEVHSRKPSLRRLFDEILPAGYQALEIFARNLTAGWWSWGNEVLLFQHAQYWTDDSPASPEPVWGGSDGDCAPATTTSHRAATPLLEINICSPGVASS
ncbi:MT-A70-domain-containing protein [Podospora conica]|nr:MT-A70-domain-containing protein [Schizothecium conicum]